MGRGEFEEILEECLSALLEGRRSIEESLSLYPAWRGYLEPLLRSAQRISEDLDQAPSPYAKQRALERFLEAARVRRRFRQQVPVRRSWPWWRWAPAGLAAVLAIGAVSFVSSTFMAAEDQGFSVPQTEPVSVAPYTPGERTPVVREQQQPPLRVSLARVREHVGQLEEAVREGSRIDPELLLELQAANSELAAGLDSRGVPLIDRMAAVSVASREYELLQALPEEQPDVEPEALMASLMAAAEVLEKLGATPTPPPAESPSPGATVGEDAIGDSDGGMSPTPTSTATPSE